MSDRTPSSPSPAAPRVDVDAIRARFEAVMAMNPNTNSITEMLDREEAFSDIAQECIPALLSLVSDLQRELSEMRMAAHEADKNMARYIRANGRLDAELSELRADKERLDWLEASNVYTSLRLAIDAASRRGGDTGAASRTPTRTPE